VVNTQFVFLVPLVVFAMIVVSKSTIVVPEGSAYVVERLGRYEKTLDAVGGVPLDALNASRRGVDAGVVRDLGTKTRAWGVEPLRHEITDISRLRKESHT
jgi:regulator of protease activity HflC (stomatin/prohibitin superfamily)